MTKRNSSAELREYLFIDVKRLDLYLNQIHDPVAYDNIPEWNVELSVTGPKISGKQAHPSRERTNHEKLELFGRYLTKNKMVATRRHTPFNPERNDFYFEKIEACSGIFSSEGFDLKIWICTDKLGGNDDRWDRWKDRCLILIQDFGGRERDQRQISGYSGLLLLGSELEWLNDTPLNDINIKLYELTKAEKNISFDPRTSLKQIGFKFTDTRQISTLYRMRACCYAYSGEDGACSTVVGYPIAIWQ